MEQIKNTTKHKSSTGFRPSINSSGSPVSDPVISSEFSNQRKHPVTGKLVAHYGIDIVDRDRSKTLGKAVVSATDGTIASVKPKSDGNGAGNRIHIIDNAGYKHSYFHLSDNNFGSNIRAGAPVSMGQKIGEIGNTGRSSGPHLHYETVHPNGTKMNPRLINAGLRMAPNTHEVREFEYEYEFEYS
ncbi:MAG: M23 family metallopeptidase [Saprospiraceae bacterium]|nr:M23 family metallopeptidase [Saprospiraceae bacterium]